MDQSDDKASIINGIIAEATREAEELMHQAEQGGAERRDAAAAQGTRLIREAEERAAAQIKTLEHDSATRIPAAKRHISLGMRKKVFDEVMDGVMDRLSKEIHTSAYRDTLIGWITEAAMGLRSEVATVNSSAPERNLLEEILPEAEREIQRVSGNSVKLLISTGSPLTSQGIVLTSQDGKTAFSNQVHTRLTRYQTEIRKLVHDRLFREME